MKLTMKGDYGLRAMLDMAAYYGQGPIESADIAVRQHVPEQYLDQILMVLRKEGLVKSVRGPKGGHMLAKAPSQITMADVMQALEGYVPPMECLPNPDFCKLSPGTRSLAEDRFTHAANSDFHDHRRTGAKASNW